MKHFTTLFTTFFFLFPIFATAQFTSGTGAENDPYIISTPAQLAQLVTFVNASETNETYADKHYKLANDIDLSEIASWTPIGINSYNSYFKGYFNGDNHIITGLKINSTSLQYHDKNTKFNKKICIFNLKSIIFVSYFLTL